VRLVSVPIDADTDVVLGAKDLANSGASAAESFDLLDGRPKPLGDRIGLLEPAHGVVVSKSERSHAAFAFVLAKLERLQRQNRDLSDQRLLRGRRHELLGISQTSGPDNLSAKRLNCSGKPTFLRGQRMGSIWVLKAVVQGMSIVLRTKGEHLSAVGTRGQSMEPEDHAAVG
jgi:hypothetical protein